MPGDGSQTSGPGLSGRVGEAHAHPECADTPERGTPRAGPWGTEEYLTPDRLSGRCQAGGRRNSSGAGVGRREGPERAVAGSPGCFSLLPLAA